MWIYTSLIIPEAPEDAAGPAYNLYIFTPAFTHNICLIHHLNYKCLPQSCLSSSDFNSLYCPSSFLQFSSASCYPWYSLYLRYFLYQCQVCLGSLTFLVKCLQLSLDSLHGKLIMLSWRNTCSLIQSGNSYEFLSSQGNRLFCLGFIIWLILCDFRQLAEDMWLLLWLRLAKSAYSLLFFMPLMSGIFFLSCIFHMLYFNKHLGYSI